MIASATVIETAGAVETAGAIGPRTTAAVALAAAAIALVPFTRQALLLVRPGRNVFFARWGFAAVLVGLVLGGLVGWAFHAFVGPIGGVDLAPVVGLAIACVVAVRAAGRTHPEGWRALGLESPGTGRDHAAAVVALVLGAPAIAAAAIGWPLLFDATERAWSPLAASALGGDVLALVALVLVLPLLVEVFLRGLCTPLFAQNFSERGGIVVAALLGAGLWGPAAFGAQLVLGCLAGAVRLRTQRTLPCVVMHALYNAAALAIGAGAHDGAGPLWSPL